MSENRQHHWKIWLTLILIIGIVGLLLYTDAGKKTLSIFKLGQFTRTAPASSAVQFPITLNSNMDAFYSQVYKLTNTSFVANGICRQSIKLDKIVLLKEATRCSAILGGFSGTVEYTKAGSIAVSGDSTIIYLDDSVYSSSTPIKVDLEVIPFKFILESLSQQKISLQSVSGTISREGRGLENLGNTSIEISNFAGSLKLENGTTILNGIANSVKGTGFSWP